MANIAALAVQLSANIAQYQQAMKKAGDATTSFTDKFTSGAASIAKWGAALTAAVGAVGAFFTHLGAERIDQVAKLSDRLGSSTEEVMALQYAASVAGSSAETMASSLDKLSKHLGNPSQETLTAVSQLGLKLEDLTKASAIDRLSMIADGLSMIGDDARRASIAQALFGKSGVELLNTLERGGKGLREMADEAERLGITFNRIDAAKVEAANDAISRMKASFQGLFQKIAIDLAPFIEGMANKFTELGIGSQNFAKLLVPAMRAVVVAVGSVIDGIVSLKDEIADLVDALAMAKAAASGDQFGMGKAFGRMGARAALAKERKPFADRFGNAFDGFVQGADNRAQDSVAERTLRRWLLPIIGEVSRTFRGLAGAGMLLKGGQAAAAAAQNPVVQGVLGFLKQAAFGNRTVLTPSEAMAGIGQDRLRLNELADQKYGGSRVLAQMFGEGGMPEPTRIAGVSGTFGSLGGRMTTAQSIAQQQLDVAREQLDTLKSIDGGLDEGVPLP